MGRKVLISGWYGHGNLGDEAVLAGLLRSLRATGRDPEVSVLTDDPARTRAEHAIRVVGRSGAGHRRRLLSELRAVRRADVLAIGGGGLVKDFGDQPGNVHAWVRPGLIAGRFGRKTMWYAMGVDDLRHASSAEIARRAAERVDVLTVRDEGSARKLRDAGLQREPLVTADPAIVLGSPGGSATAERIVAVCPRRWMEASTEVADPELEARLWDELAEALDTLAERHSTRALLVPFRVHPADDDRVVCLEIHRRMRRPESASVTDVPATPDAAARLLAGCDFAIGMRLHSLILAAASATPFHALEYMPKVRFFCERVGLANERSGLGAAAERHRLAARLVESFERRDSLRDRLRETVPRLQRLAQLNAELLADLATGGGGNAALEREARTLAAAA